ncbi:wall-associated receptor kinase-like 22 [Olea europaea var. sylvestris]|uniref:wall-associated receptor kinase-like 22 n=1 Tax=Olea europaea var. sylvestris TaxID=158386 RepID=UPI000C1D3AE6|nr:wall-associated receptor kinase-like 22 [Olea europaea var. sylvestris]
MEDSISACVGICSKIQDLSEGVCSGIGWGYNSKCSIGSIGNPYLSPGYVDVDECKDHPCDEFTTCDSFPGLCIALVLLFLLGVTFVLYKVLKKRKRNKCKQKFFQRNGGLLLQQQISSNEDVLERMKLFRSKELEKATDRFNESRIIGKGGRGTVYKGMLSDGRIVTVKKSQSVNANQQEEFINEVVILSQINHRNIVKLLGCCLESEVPLLVYEFISNGTLFDLIHDESPNFPFSWDVRSRIADEVAGALAYLHYSTSTPIYHGDIKSSNILLDENYRPKVSNFGISRSIAVDKTHFTTLVKGTFCYLDPKYFRPSQFTDKSDVYSFGVALIELLSGHKPIISSDIEDERSLAAHFLMSIEQNCLHKFFDPIILEHDKDEDIITIATLAYRCLDLNGKKRPTMKKVSMELENIGLFKGQATVQSNTQVISTKMGSVSLSDLNSTWTSRDRESTSDTVIQNLFPDGENREWEEKLRHTSAESWVNAGRSRYHVSHVGFSTTPHSPGGSITSLLEHHLQKGKEGGIKSLSIGQTVGSAPPTWLEPWSPSFLNGPMSHSLATWQPFASITRYQCQSVVEELVASRSSQLLVLPQPVAIGVARFLTSVDV